MLDEHDKQVIDSFLAANWSEFIDHCIEHDAEPEEIAQKLAN